MSFYWPTYPSRITEEAGTRGGNHWGMDFGVPLGTPLIAPFAGTVVWIGNDGASGLLPGTNIKANGPALILDIRRDDGLISRFAHLNGYNVKVGQRVNAGDVVAYSGNTGFSTGPHLHWETRWNREFSPRGWVNPRSFNPQIFENKNQQQEQQPSPLIGGKKMYLTWDTVGTGYLATEDGFYAMPEPTIYALFSRLIKSTPDKTEKFTREEIGRMNQVLRGLAQGNSHKIDSAAVAKSVTEQIAKQGVKVDPSEIAKAVDDALKDDFAAIPGQIGKKLSS